MGAISKSKVVRFTEIVNKLGKPHTATLWKAPEKDPAFQKAVKEHRIMTVHQENRGQKSDIGSIGFKKEKTAAYLIFPKPIDEYEGARIVGIKYELIKEPEPEDPISVKEYTAQNPPSSLPLSKKTKHFSVTVQQIFNVTKTEVVEAETKSEAKKAALQKIHDDNFEQHPPDVEKVVAVSET